MLAVFEKKPGFLFSVGFFYEKPVSGLDRPDLQKKNGFPVKTETKKTVFRKTGFGFPFLENGAIWRLK